MDAQEKLGLLADDSRFDLACACGTKDRADHRVRGGEGRWLYPVSVPRGGVSVMLKTLLSNACVNDCRYCPLRNDRDTRRCSLVPDEVARVFMDYARQGKAFGLFLSSGVMRDPDYTMDRLAAVARILRRKYQYSGYIHLKVIPGASDAAIDDCLSLASAVSLNVEVPTRAAFRSLSDRKDYDRDIVRPMKRISRLTARGMPHARVKQSTQFIVGASDETDRDLVRATFGLYKRLNLSRVYFSAYQRGLGHPSLPGEREATAKPEDGFVREHRLYQVDWLLRKYGFADEEIPLGADGNLSLTTDPKTLWADAHPEFFPVHINRADKFELLRVPGLGPVTVKRILELRQGGGKVRSLGQLGKTCARLRTAAKYLTFPTHRGRRTRRCE